MDQRATSLSDQGLPVAVALAALTLAVVFAIALSHGSGRVSGSRSAAASVKTDVRPPLVPAPFTPPAANFPIAVVTREQAPALQRALSPRVPVRHYDGGGYTLSYPTGWAVTTAQHRIATYAEMQIESADATAKVTIDHSPSELTDPAFKAAQVEAATSRTGGYRRLVFRPIMIGGRSAFEWVFTLAGARDPQRADIFVNTGHDGFAFLAHGTGFSRAVRAAHAMAASVAAKG